MYVCVGEVGGGKFHLQGPVDSAERNSQEASQQWHGVTTLDAQRVRHRPAYRTRPLLHISSSQEKERMQLLVRSVKSGFRKTCTRYVVHLRHLRVSLPRTLPSQIEPSQLQMRVPDVELPCSVGWISD